MARRARRRRPNGGRVALGLEPVTQRHVLGVGQLRRRQGGALQLRRTGDRSLGDQPGPAGGRSGHDLDRPVRGGVGGEGGAGSFEGDIDGSDSRAWFSCGPALKAAVFRVSGLRSLAKIPAGDTHQSRGVGQVGEVAQVDGGRLRVRRRAGRRARTGRCRGRGGPARAARSASAAIPLVASQRERRPRRQKLESGSFLTKSLLSRAVDIVGR